MVVSLRPACPPPAHRTVHCIPHKRSLALQSCLVLSQRRHKVSRRLFSCIFCDFVDLSVTYRFGATDPLLPVRCHVYIRKLSYCTFSTPELFSFAQTDSARSRKRRFWGRDNLVPRASFPEPRSP